MFFIQMLKAQKTMSSSLLCDIVVVRRIWLGRGLKRLSCRRCRCRCPSTVPKVHKFVLILLYGDITSNMNFNAHVTTSTASFAFYNFIWQPECEAKIKECFFEPIASEGNVLPAVPWVLPTVPPYMGGMK